MNKNELCCVRDEIYDYVLEQKWSKTFFTILIIKDTVKVC